MATTIYIHLGTTAKILPFEHPNTPGFSPLTIPTDKSFGSWPMAKQNKDTWENRIKIVYYWLSLYTSNETIYYT